MVDQDAFGFSESSESEDDDDDHSHDMTNNKLVKSDMQELEQMIQKEKEKVSPKKV